MGVASLKTMDFSVITPNLNGARFLRDCLESVAVQGGVEVEHLVLDGGSSDASAEIAGDFPDVDWTSEKDRGISNAINKGFERASGEWVMWLNSDDRLKPGSLESVGKFAARHPEADVIFGAFDFVDVGGGRIRTAKLFPWNRFISVHHCCYVPSTAAFFRRSTVMDQGVRLREDFHYVMDGELYARMDEMGKKFVYFPMVLADFRWHGANQSTRHLGHTKDMDRVLSAERQHVESRAIRRVYGITLFEDPYLNGIVDGALWLLALGARIVAKVLQPNPGNL